MDYLQIRELYHHGIKGQKWGVRRYQYEDGSLTEEGRRRYNTGYYEDKKDNPNSQLYKKKDDPNIYYKDKDGNEHQFKTNIKDLDQKEITDLVKQIKLENSLEKEVSSRQPNTAKDTKDILDSSARVLDATARALPTGNGKYIKKDYSKLSDQELRNKISRLQLEESYGRLSGDTKYVKSGSEKAREILQTTGAVIAIGASAAALTATIVDIRAKHKNKIGMPELIQSALLGGQLVHYGIKGQKWGIRRFQNEDGTLTPEGRKRYNIQSDDYGIKYGSAKNKESIQDLSDSMTIEGVSIKNSNDRKMFVDFLKNQGVDTSNLVIITTKGSDMNKSFKLKGENAYDDDLSIQSFTGLKNDEAYKVLSQLGCRWMEDIIADNESREIKHYGIKGQKWGVRRFQNEDGTLTESGQIRYGGKTHINELTPSEKRDLNKKEQELQQEKQQRNKKILIGVGIVSAATAAVGAAWFASKFKANKTELDIMKNQEAARLAKNAKATERRNATIAAKRAAGITPGVKTLIQNNGNMVLASITNNAFIKQSERSGPMDYLQIRELYHYGIKGQKWGIRRFQNEDGSYTTAGKQRYNTNLGTKEILKNTTSYDKLTRKQQKQYTNYGKESGAKKGFLVGMGLGASVGIGKTVADLVKSPNSRKHSATSITNRFVTNAILGAFGGGLVGTVAGAYTGKKAAQSKLADRGKEYVDQLLQTPSRRLEE